MTGTDWKADLRLRLEDFVDTFVVRGANPHAVLDAITQEIASLRIADDQDADAAADPSRPAVDEPSNDWPAADDTPGEPSNI